MAAQKSGPKSNLNQVCDSSPVISSVAVLTVEIVVYVTKFKETATAGDFDDTKESKLAMQGGKTH